jgi:hypothetical protein
MYLGSLVEVCQKFEVANLSEKFCKIYPGMIEIHHFAGSKYLNVSSSEILAYVDLTNLLASMTISAPWH